MVKKTSKKKAEPRRNVIPPESMTGYPKKKPCKCPAEILSKTAGGGKASAS
jgi:hypothetical protein